MRGADKIVRDDVEMSFEPAPGVAAAADRVGSVFLDTQLDDELRDLGLLRELQNRIQTIRKEMDLEFTDRIRVWVAGSDRVRAIVEAYRETLAPEVLAVEVLTTKPDAGVETREADVEGEAVGIGVARA
jgi:isoleucyl-tRNA synthetase